MTNEEKQLLLKDLCARLPYGVKISTRLKGNPSFVDSELSGELLDDFAKKDWGIIKPYLRSLSSMTKKEKKEYDKLRMSFYKNAKDASLVLIDWLNAHHFDHRGLIEKGLAIEVTEENNPYKE